MSAWTADGRHVIFGRTEKSARPGATSKVALWRVPAEGGEPIKLGLAMPSLHHVRVHPDGRQIAFEAGERKLEVWAIENFLPELQAKR